MRIIKILILLILTSCAQNQEGEEVEYIEKVSLIAFSYIENQDRNGYVFYLGSFHELGSDGRVKIMRRDRFNAPLKLFTDSLISLTNNFPELAERFRSDTVLLKTNTKSQRFTNKFMHMLILKRSRGGETVVAFEPDEGSEDVLATLVNTLLRPNPSLNRGILEIDTISLKSKADSIAKRLILPKHPLPPISELPPLPKSIRLIE